ncbi:MAG TPA: PEP-CTERM sorting domain-containing protein [Phycisphaerae bacterium]|nr:PEP-CTERM sorting domain-containing protein [Phycisphaerae bacterium]
MFMKKSTLGIFSSGAAASAAFFSTGTVFANNITISGSGWNPASNLVSYGSYAVGNGDTASASYSTNYGGSAFLTMSNDDANATGAYVGTPPGYLGNLGILKYDTMSFNVVSNTATNSEDEPITTLPPYALFTLEDTNGNYFDVINLESGSGAYSLYGTSSIHLFDFQNYSDDGIWDVPLSSLYNTSEPVGDGTEDYGDMTVVAALANIGTWDVTGDNFSDYINSMTVSTPEPASLGLLAVGGLGLLLKRKRKMVSV